MEQRIYPSVIAENQKELEELLHKFKGVAKTIHLDVVDGIFAPNHSLDFSFALPANFRYRAHVMVVRPEKWIRRNFGAIELFIPQFEKVKDKKKYIRWMRKKKRRVAFAINPETSVRKMIKSLPFVDEVLVLTVHPGFYGKKFIKKELQKIIQIKKINPKIKVIVDGGINLKTIILAKKAGADYFVVGSVISRSRDPKSAVRQLEKRLKVKKE